MLTLLSFSKGERMRSLIQAAEISFLQWVAGLSLINSVRSSVMWEGIAAEPPHRKEPAEVV